jgi:hypothetical protein
MDSAWSKAQDPRKRSRRAMELGPHPSGKRYAGAKSSLTKPRGPTCLSTPQQTFGKSHPSFSFHLYMMNTSVAPIINSMLIDHPSQTGLLISSYIRFFNSIFYGALLTTPKVIDPLEVLFNLLADAAQNVLTIFRTRSPMKTGHLNLIM